MNTPPSKMLRRCGWGGLALAGAAGALCVLTSALQRRARRPMDAALRRLSGGEAWIGDLVERT